MSLQEKLQNMPDEKFCYRQRKNLDHGADKTDR